MTDSKFQILSIARRNLSPRSIFSGQSGTLRYFPLIPESSIAGRALVTVIAIMTFLATLTVGIAILISESSRDWSSQITQEMTIQIKPQPGRKIDADVDAVTTIVKNFPGIDTIKVFTKQESANLLELWLGSGIATDDLPIPRLIAIKPATKQVDVEKLRVSIKEKVPTAVVDDHRMWNERLNSMANALVIAALFILGLVLVAMALAITFATRGALAGTKDIVDVLHFVGAHDTYISREFQRHFFKLGLKGALIGGLLTLAAFTIAGAMMSSWTSGPGSEQIESLFGTFSLGWSGVCLVALITILIAFLVGNISRQTVFRHLQTLR